MWYSMARGSPRRVAQNACDYRPNRLYVEELESRMVLAAALPTSISPAFGTPAPARQATPPSSGTLAATSPQSNAQSPQTSANAPAPGTTNAAIATMLADVAARQSAAQTVVTPQPNPFAAANPAPGLANTAAANLSAAFGQNLPATLLVQFGYVGLLQRDPMGRFNIPMLLAGGGNEEFTEAQRLLDRMRGIMAMASEDSTDAAVSADADSSDAQAVLQTAADMDVPETVP